MADGVLRPPPTPVPTDDPPYPYPPLILHKGMEVVSWLCKGVISVGVVVLGCWPQNVGRGGE